MMLMMAATPLAARADITSRMTSSVQLTVNAAATQMQRVGNSYSISGNNVDTTDGTTANTVSAGAISSGVYGPGTISAVQDDPGESFSFATAFTQGDALHTAGPDVGDVSPFSNQSIYQCADDWCSKQVSTNGLVSYYKAYYNS